jgi:guanylate kinase
MAQHEQPRILTFVGVSGTGKTTLSRQLHARDNFRVLPGVFTREPRVGEFSKENRQLSNEEFDELAMGGDLLWDLRGGDGTRYGKSKADIDAALRDHDQQYVHALIPDAAVTFAQYCGPAAVRTMFLPAPHPQELRERMLRRGDAKESVDGRLAIENPEEWLEIVRDIPGLHIAEATDLEGLHSEALNLMES